MSEKSLEQTGAMMSNNPQNDNNESDERHHQVEFERAWRQETTKVELPLPLPEPTDQDGTPDGR